jgi:hypothetical protein
MNRRNYRNNAMYFVFGLGFGLGVIGIVLEENFVSKLLMKLHRQEELVKQLYERIFDLELTIHNAN